MIATRGDGTAPGMTEESFRWAPWLALIVCVGLCLRLYGLANYGLWYDETSVLGVAEYLATPAKFFDSAFGNEAPLHAVFIGAWYTLVMTVLGLDEGSYWSDFLIRLAPCLFGTGAIALTFLLGRSITGSARTGLAAAALVALSPFQIYYSQEFRAYAMLVCFTALALWCLVRALSDSRQFLPWVGFVFFNVLAIHVHTVGIWNVVAFNVYFVLMLPVHGRRIMHWVIANLVIILAVLPVLQKAFYTSYVFHQGAYAWYPNPDLITVLITFKNFFVGYSPNASVYRLVTLLAAALLVGGCWALRRDVKSLVLLLVMGFVPLILNVAYWHTQEIPYFMPRLMIFSGLPCSILIAHGVFALRATPLRWGAAGLLVVLTIPALSDHYTQRIHPAWHHRIGARYKPENRAAAQFVKQRFEKGDVILHRANFTLMPFRYYLNEEQHAVEFTLRATHNNLKGYPDINAYKAGDNIHQPIAVVVDETRRVWFIESSWEPQSPDPSALLFLEWLDLRFVPEMRVLFDGIVVHLYVPRSAAPRVTESVVLVDAGARRLRHYYAVGSDGGVEQLGQYQVAGELSEFGSGLGSFGLSLSAPDGATRIEELGPAFPVEGSGPLSFEMDLWNNESAALDIEVRVHESVEMIEALEFQLAEPLSSVWTPAFEAGYSAYPHHANRFALAAHMTPSASDGKMVFREMDLPAGAYRLFARCLVGEVGENVSGAKVDFAIGADADAGERSRIIGGILPLRTWDGAVWKWIDVGDFETFGGLESLSLSLSNPDKLAAAFFQVSHVLIQPREPGWLAPDDATARSVHILPGEAQRLAWDLPARELHRRRVDIEAFNPATQEYRRAHFYIRTMTSQF